MSIIPPEIPITIPEPIGYVIDPLPTTRDKLDQPSHSDLHTKHGGMVTALNNRLSTVEGYVNNLWPEVDRARLAAHQWEVRGQLDESMATKLLLPPIWNLTGRQVLFSSARATVFTAPVGESILVDIFVGPAITGDGIDDTFTSVLDTPLEIPPGSFTSDVVNVYSGGFVDSPVHPIDNVLVAAILQVGTTAPGADLTIQCNRLL